MKKVLVVLAILASSIALNAKDVTKNVKSGSFDEIHISSSFEVTLIKSNKHSVEITVDEEVEPYLRAEVVRGELFIGLNNERIPRSFRSLIGKRTLKAVVYTPNFTTLSASGASTIKVEGEFNLREVDIKASGASSIKDLAIKAGDIEVSVSGASNMKNFSISANDCDFDVSGASNINGEIFAQNLGFDMSGASDASIGGKVDNVNYELSGACSIKAYDVDTKKVQVELSGASSSYIYATNELVIELSGASTINYKGPKDLRLNVRHAGRGTGIHYKGEK